MLVHALRGCGMDPGYLVGGAVRSTGANAGWGAGEWLVVEADESDRSLLELAPRDRRADERRARPPHDLLLPARRRRDVPRVPRARRSAPSVVWDRPQLLALAPAGIPLAPFDAEPELTPAARASRSTASTVELAVPGAHNARNAAAALTAARLAGADPAAAAAALRDFQGAGRRFERLGTTPQGADGGRRLRAPPDRGRGDARGRAHARAAPR